MRTPSRSRAESLRRQRSVFSAFMLLLQTAPATFLWIFLVAGGYIPEQEQSNSTSRILPSVSGAQGLQTYLGRAPGRIGVRQVGWWVGGRVLPARRERGFLKPTQCWLDISPNWVLYTTCPTIHDGPAQKIGALPSRTSFTGQRKVKR